MATGNRSVRILGVSSDVDGFIARTHMVLNRYATYHALDWVEGKTRGEIDAEIQRVHAKGDYQWHEVGCREFDLTRVRVLSSFVAGSASLIVLDAEVNS